MLAIDAALADEPVDLPAGRLTSRGCISSARPTPRRTRPGPRRSPRRWASSADHAARAESVPRDRRPSCTCCSRACSGWLLFFVCPAIQMFLVSLSTGNVRSGLSSRPGTGATTQRRSPSTGRGYVRTRSCTAAWPRSCAFAARLPAGLRDRVPRWPLQEPAAVPRHRAVLHELPDPHDLVADHPRRQRPLPGPAEAPRHRAAELPPARRRRWRSSSGITYKFLPFMVLPLYVALEKIDKRLIEAAEDLYAGPWRRRARSPALIVGGVLAAWSSVVVMQLDRNRCRAVRSPAARHRGAHRDVPDLRVVRPGHLPAEPAGRLRWLDPRRSSRPSVTTSTPSCWATRRPR